MKIDKWKKCYPSNWQGKIVPDAITHPAKYSSKLIRKVYDHLFEEGWIQEGGSVVDPFGGVALGAFDAMRLGLSWRGVELEEKFVQLGNANIDLWNKRYSTMPHWSRGARLFKGDSRDLAKILGIEADASISSPPFSQQQSGGGIAKAVMGDSDYQITSAAVQRVKKANMAGKGFGYQAQGETDGQLANLAANQAGFDAAISSPPFRQSEGGTPTPKPGGSIDAALQARHAAGNSSAAGYGSAGGQLANMKEGDFDAAISSPPFEDSLDRGGVDAADRRKLARSMGISNAEHVSPIDMEKIGGRNQTYGATDGNIGNDAGEDFWSAARIIVEQVYITLRPGGHVCWVVKDFVKKGQVVPFCDQWRRLCEAVGFETLHEHHAELIRHNGTSHTLDGGEVKHLKSSKSFFRRVAESHGSPAIDFEVAYCMIKPMGDGFTQQGSEVVVE
jgi:hypothetical protein